jgi:hypothetical protein
VKDQVLQAASTGTAVFMPTQYLTFRKKDATEQVLGQSDKKYYKVFYIFTHPCPVGRAYVGKFQREYSVPAALYKTMPTSIEKDEQT